MKKIKKTVSEQSSVLSKITQLIWGWSQDQNAGLLRLNPGFLQNNEKRRPLYDPLPVGSGRLMIHFIYLFVIYFFYFSIQLTDTSILISGVHMVPFRKYSTVMVDKRLLFLRRWFSENSLMWTSFYLIGKDKCVCLCMCMYGCMCACACVPLSVCVWKGLLLLLVNVLVTKNREYSHCTV